MAYGVGPLLGLVMGMLSVVVIGPLLCAFFLLGRFESFHDLYEASR